MIKMKVFIQNLKNLWIWILPIIWNDRDWNYSCIDKITLYKLILVRLHTAKRKSHVGWENEVKWMTRCLELLRMLIEGKYLEEHYIETPPSRRGFSEHLRKNENYVSLFYENKRHVCTDLWEDKARTLLWKILEWRYRNWWY